MGDIRETIKTAEGTKQRIQTAVAKRKISRPTKTASAKPATTTVTATASGSSQAYDTKVTQVEPTKDPVKENKVETVKKLVEVVKTNYATAVEKKDLRDKYTSQPSVKQYSSIPTWAKEQIAVPENIRKAGQSATK